MEYFLLFYNMANILLYGVCACGFLLLWRRSRDRRELMWLAIMFCIFICDNLVFAMTEFIPRFMELYRQMMELAPFLNNLIAISMIFSFRMILAYLLDDKPGTNEKLIHVAVFVLLFLLTAMASAWVGRLIYQLINLGAVAAVLIRGYVVLFRRRPDWPERQWKQIFWLLNVTAVLHAGGSMERMFVRLVESQPADRAICYELFGLFCVAVGLWYLVRHLGGAPAHGVSEAELLELFVSQYRLTNREAELLPMLLAGADNAAISEKHFISLNTVKVHTHNIYQKLGVERRSQIPLCLNEFKRRYEN